MSKRNIVALALMLAAVTLHHIGPAQADQRLLVEVDKAQILRLPAPASSIIIGNPMIADASVQDTQMLIITGKSYGTTNLIVLDANGMEVANRTLEVRFSSPSTLTMYKGPSRQSMSCSPNCEPTLLSGDQGDYFTQVLEQMTSRGAAASGKAATN